MTFDEKLKNLRKSRNLSQEELANELNVSRQAISKWELGNIPEIENIIKISDYFDCSIDYLLREPIDNSTDVIQITQKQKRKTSSPVDTTRKIALIASCFSFVLILLVKISSHIIYGNTDWAYKATMLLISNYSLEFLVYSLLIVWFLSGSVYILLPLTTNKKNLTKSDMILKVVSYLLFVIGTYIIVMELLYYGIIFQPRDIILLFIYFALTVIVTIYQFINKRKLNL